MLLGLNSYVLLEICYYK